MFPLIPLPIKEAVAQQAAFQASQESNVVSINSTSYKGSGLRTPALDGSYYEFPLIPLPIKEAVSNCAVSAHNSTINSPKVSINSTSYKGSGKNC